MAMGNHRMSWTFTMQQIGRWVTTHPKAGSNLHAHCLAISRKQSRLWTLFMRQYLKPLDGCRARWISVIARSWVLFFWLLFIAIFILLVFYSSYVDTGSIVSNLYAMMLATHGDPSA